MADVNEAQMVGMAEVKVCRSAEDVLIALGLGSCVGICAYDAHAGVAGLAHVVLPGSEGLTGAAGKFADTAVPLLLEKMMEQGAVPGQIRFALVGGAQLFSGVSADTRLNIGPRNIAAVQNELSRRRLRVVAADVGGSSGRTVTLFGDGRVRVKILGKGEQDLVDLGTRTNLARAAQASGRLSPGIEPGKAAAVPHAIGRRAA